LALGIAASVSAMRKDVTAVLQRRHFPQTQAGKAEGGKKRMKSIGRVNIRRRSVHHERRRSEAWEAPF
jgi:translation elongation factor EF-4